jgi:hypothetical protein
MRSIFTERLKRMAIMIVTLAFFCGFLSAADAEAATVTFKIIAANPSQVRTQRVPIKVYLPEEVKPSDILDLGGLELEFDSERSLYYVYKNDTMLEPKQIRSFEVEIDDIWTIPPGDLSNTEKRIAYLVEAFKDSEYYDRMTSMRDEFEGLSVEISRTQNDENLSRSQHIGVYRTNSKAYAALRQKVSEMEKILERERGPLTPDMLTKTPFQTESPTKTATWIAIFAILFFLGLISIVVFFTWYRQTKATEKTLSQTKKSSFLEFGDKESKQEGADQ